VLHALDELGIKLSLHIPDAFMLRSQSGRSTDIWVLSSSLPRAFINVRRKDRKRTHRQGGHARHWGWRVLFSRSPLTSRDTSGMRPLTGLTIAMVFFMAIGAARYSINQAEDIRDNGTGSTVSVHLNGDAAPLKEQAPLLGSSSAFVFLWWPQQRRAEALPISAIRRLQSAALAPRAALAPAVNASRTKPAAE